MKIEVGDTIRLKSSLKVGEIYDNVTFMDTMDCRPNRLTIRKIDYDVIFAKGIDGRNWWYTFVMLDMRTLRKGVNKVNNEQITQ